MIFHGRTSLRIASVILTLISLPIPWLSYSTILHYDLDPGLFFLLALIPFVVGILLANDSFGYIRIDDDGVLIKEVLHGRLLRWNDIASVHCKSNIACELGAGTVESRARIEMKSGKSLVIDDVYEGDVFIQLVQEAHRRELYRCEY
jgi:hypothetical protein